MSPEAVDRISKFLRTPPTVAKLNSEAFAALPLAEPAAVDEIFETMWVQISELFLEVEAWQLTYIFLLCIYMYACSVFYICIFHCFCLFFCIT